MKKLDEMIKLPAWAEWFDDMALPWLVDAACGLINGEYGHAWGAAVFHKKEIEEAAEAMPTPDAGNAAETPKGGAGHAGGEKD